MSKGLKIFLFGGGAAVIGAIAYAVIVLLPSTDHLKLIPKDAMFVFTADLKQLALKADPGKIKNMKFMQKMQKQMEMSKSEETKVWEDILKDPASTGVDLAQDAYSFGTGFGDVGSYGVVFKLTSASNFETFVKRMPLKSSVNKENGYQTYKVENGIYLAWNSDAGMLLGGKGDEGIKKQIGLLMTQKESESIVSNKNFMAFHKNKYDIAAFINYSTIMSMIPTKRSDVGIDQQTQKAIEMLKGTYAGFTLNFDNEDVALTTTYYNDDPKKLESFKMWKDKGLNDAFLANITTKSVLAIAAANIDFKKWYGYVSENEMMKDKVKEALDKMELSDADVKDMLEGQISFAVVDYREIPKTPEEIASEEEMAAMYKTMSDQYGGNYGSPSDYTPKKKFAPIITGTVGINNMAVVDKLIKKSGAMEENGMYTWPGRGMTMYMIKTKSSVSMTNDKELAQKFAKDGTLGGAINEPVKSLVTENPFSGFFDLTLSHYSKETQDYLRSNMGEQAFPKFEKFMKIFQNITMKAKEMTFTMQLNMEKGEGNSLYRIINDIDEAAAQ